MADGELSARRDPDYQRRYREEHAARRREYSRAYYAAHREKILEARREGLYRDYQHRYYAEHKDHANAKSREWYAATGRPRYLAGRDAALAKYRELGCACQQCGRRGPYCWFEWAHVTRASKFRQVSALYLRGPAAVLAEIEKCRLLCCLCHKEETAREEDRDWALEPPVPYS